MGFLTLHATDEKMLRQLSTFIKVGDKSDLFASERAKALREMIAAWLPQMSNALYPAQISAQHRAKIAPQLAVFARTHELVGVLSLLFEAWGRVGGNEAEVAAAVGPMRVGEDEQEDEQKLRVWAPYFVKVFGAAGLPAELHADAVKKQLAAHVAARQALPGTSDGQVFRAAQSEKKALRASGVDYWQRMHALLDAEFGTAQGAFATKAMYGYDRRLRGGGPSKKKRIGEAPPDGGKGAEGSAASGDSSMPPAGDAAKKSEAQL